MSRPLFHVLIALEILCFTACSRNESNPSGNLTSPIEPDTARISQLIRKASTYKTKIDSNYYYSALAVKTARELGHPESLGKALEKLAAGSAGEATI
jgi:hypothetical protein